MKIRNKVISALCAFSMLAAMLTAATVSAEGKPSVNIALKSASENTVVLDVTMSGYTGGAVEGVKFGVTYPTELVSNAESDISVQFDSKLTGTPMINRAKAYDGKVGVYGSVTSPVAMSCTDAVAEVSIKLNQNIADIDDAIEFNIVEGYLKDGTGSYTYDGNRTTLDVAGSFKVYPSVAVTDITAADPVYTGKNVNLTAVVDADKLGDRVIEWDAVNGDVTPDPADSTKAVLVPAADGKVTVIAKVDNNGTVAEYSKDFTATTKADPLPYTISATAVSANGETTITVKPDAEYTYGEDETAPDYVLVAQFYADGKEAASWVKIEADALTSGEAKFTVGAQAAKTVSVTAYALDTEGNPTDTIVGQN